MQYTAKGIHNRHFELLDSTETTLGKLDYTTWFSTKAEVLLPNGDKYEIGNSNMWHTMLHMTKDDAEKCTMKYNWKAQIIITMEGGTTYMLKPKGFFHSSYVLMNEQEQELVTLHPDFQWAKLTFNYAIETNDNYTEAQDPVLILLLLYCTNHMKQMQSGAA